MTMQKFVILPLTRTGRKYGYIMWKKKQDVFIKELFRENTCVDLQVRGGLQKRKRIDWKRRRIGITYSLTRALDRSIAQIKVYQLKKPATFSVTFE